MLADGVREARLRANLSQAELAKRAGVPKSTVGRIESGARNPSVELVEALIRAAGFELVPTLREPDPSSDPMIQEALARTPLQRLRDAARAANFVLRGRRALERTRE